MHKRTVGKLLGFLALVGTLAGCESLRVLTSTQEQPQTHAKAALSIAERLTEVSGPARLKGRVGYFRIQPSFWSFTDEASIQSAPEQTFRLCEKAKVERVLKYVYPDGERTQFLIEISQGGQRYFVDRIGIYDVTDVSFSSDPLSAMRSAEPWFSKSPLVRSGTVKLKTGSTDRYKAVCSDKSVFVGMTQSEFKLARGLPESINRTVVRGGEHEQWVFEGRQYFYFANDLLTGWQD